MISLMYWAGMWEEDHKPLIPLKRDPTTKKDGYLAWSYQFAPQDGPLPSYGGTSVVQQDNTSIHAAGATNELTDDTWN